MAVGWIKRHFYKYCPEIPIPPVFEPVLFMRFDSDDISNPALELFAFDPEMHRSLKDIKSFGNNFVEMPPIEPRTLAGFEHQNPPFRVGITSQILGATVSFFERTFGIIEMNHAMVNLLARKLHLYALMITILKKRGIDSW